MSALTTALALGRTASISAWVLARSLRGDLTTKAADDRLRAWAHDLLRDARASLDVSGPGLARAATDEPFVVMSNHASHYDIPALFAAIPGSMRMIAKAELFKVPVWGRAMLEAGFVRVDRRNREAAIESLRQAAEHLQSGTRIWIAPEGTRSPTGELGPFKKGGFHLALDTNTPILPVAIAGTRELLPAKAAVVGRGAHVRVRVGEPILPEPPLDALLERVRASIAGGLADLAR